jgi:hypothetical protein
MPAAVKLKVLKVWKKSNELTTGALWLFECKELKVWQ